MHSARRWGVGLACLAIAAAVTTAALAITNRASIPNVDAADPSAIVAPIGLAVLGLLVTARQPRNPTGWLFLFVAVVAAFQGVEDQYVRYSVVTHPGSLPGAAWAEWVYSWATVLIFPAGAVTLLILLLPDGELPTRRWRWLIPASVTVTVLLVLLSALAPGPLAGNSSDPNFPALVNPLGVGWLGGVDSNGASSAVLPGIVWFAGLTLLLVAIAAPVVRMRRSSGEQRQQLMWIAYALLTTAVGLVVMVFLAGSVLPSWAFDIPIVLGFGFAFPVAAGVAIFKYRLYDIDIVISRTLVYGSLAVFITAVYVGIAVGIGALVGGGGKPNLGLSILATAIVAVGFQPVRERVQRVANRLVYGRRATPYEVLSQFSERVAESYATDDVMPRMARVLAEGTGAQRADVWLRSAGMWHQASVWPHDAVRADPIGAVDGTLPTIAAGRLVEVRHQGDVLGALAVTKRSGETLTPVEENLLAHLAAQAGLVLRNVGLSADLQARLDDLRASRQRLVTAQDEERRKLERNLHDGAQQYLVAIKVKLGLVEMLASKDPERARATVAQLKGDADEALETLRDLARGIYPPLLADKGLPAALESQARKATVPVSVEATLTRRYPQEMEAAVYFCCLEALQNIQKYAEATTATIRLREHHDELRFEIEDDGTGFDVATTAKGAGLSNMVDRFDALGGEVHVTSAVGQGTRITGCLRVAVAAVA